MTIFVAVAAFSVELVFEFVIGFVAIASSSASAVSAIASASTFATFVALVVFLLSRWPRRAGLVIWANAIISSDFTSSGLPSHPPVHSRAPHARKFHFWAPASCSPLSGVPGLTLNFNFFCILGPRIGAHHSIRSPVTPLNLNFCVRLASKTRAFGMKPAFFAV